METISRQVDDLQPQERSAVELLLGHRLQGSERMILQIVEAETSDPPARTADADNQLPAWCNVYAGLSDQQVRTIDESIVRCRVTRSIE